MFSVVTSFLFVFVGVNAHGAIMVRFFDSNFSIPPYVTSVFVILLLSMILVLGVVFTFSDRLQSWTTLPIRWLFIAIAVAACQFVAQTLLTLWQSSGRALAYGALRLGHALTDGLLSVFLVVGFMATWESRLSGLALAWGIVALFAIFRLYREGWITKNFDKNYTADALRYGIPLLPHAVGGLMLSMVDRILVTNIVDVGSAGIYLAAVQIGMILGILADAINRAFAPWLMNKLRNANHEDRITIVRYTYLYFFSILIMAMLFSYLIPFFVPFLLGPEFISVTDITTFMFFGNAFTGMYYMVTNYVFYSMRTGLLSIFTISTGFVTLALNFILISEFGLKGAAISFMVGQAILFLATFWLSQYCYKMPWRVALTKTRCSA